MDGRRARSNRACCPYKMTVLVRTVYRRLRSRSCNSQLHLQEERIKRERGKLPEAPWQVQRNHRSSPLAFPTFASPASLQRIAPRANAPTPTSAAAASTVRWQPLTARIGSASACRSARLQGLGRVGRAPILRTLRPAARRAESAFPHRGIRRRRWDFAPPPLPVCSRVDHTAAQNLTGGNGGNREKVNSDPPLPLLPPVQISANPSLQSPAPTSP